MKKVERINNMVNLALFPDEEDRGFIAKTFVQATLPHSEVEGTYYERVNGDFVLSLSTQFADTGLPYGTIPRLLLVWITTEAVKTKSRELILGDSLSDFMRKLDLVPTGGRWGSITRLKDQADRLFSCTIAWRFRSPEKTEQGAYTLLSRRREEIYWWDHKNQKNYFSSQITLSQEFYEEITANPIVVRTETLKALRQSSLSMDIYTWITHRNSYARKPSYIKWEDLQFQFGAGYPLTSQGKRDFKKRFIDTLKKVAIVYPEAGKLRPEEKYLLFVPGRPDVPKLAVHKN